MSHVMNPSSKMPYTSSPDCAPVCCPDCGGLECLCRPRFFAGQLLTDEDLQRLDHYIVGKNKLHNRYLVGWGVVCGLDVVCNPCDGMVTVKPGYALSPCGDDIVVCADAPVDICAMIAKCRRKPPRDCQPAQPPAPDTCSDLTGKWILSIHYDEKPSRGIVPLRNTGGAACCTTCACGGSGSCGCRGQCSCGSKGCGCGGHNSGYSDGKSHSCGCGTKTQTSRQSGAQAQCEPTIVCESYRFEVCKVQPRPREPQPNPGALIDRFLRCVNAVQDLTAKAPTSNNPQDVQNWCCAIRDNLLDFFAEHPGYHCTIPQELAVMCQQGASVNAIKQEVAFVLAQYMKDCLCSAFLPPCPCPVEDAGVPLATITVNNKDGVCRIIDICNLDVRKFVTTFPNLAYWLSWIPTVRDLRKNLSRWCCTPVERPKVKFGTHISPHDFPSAYAYAERRTAAPTGASMRDPGEFPQSHEFAEAFASAYKRQSKTVDANTLAFAVLGLTDDQNQPFLSEAEMKHPLETVLTNQFIRPFVESMLSGRTAAAFTPGGTPPGAGGPDVTAEMAAMKEDMAAMRAELRRSKAEIEKLKRRK